MCLSLVLLLACTSAGVGDIDDGIDGRHDDGGDDDGGSDGGSGSSDGGGSEPVDIEDIDPDDLPQADNPCREPELVQVVDTYDGDTVTVRSSKGEEHIRFIGVDTPEVGYSGSAGECWGDEAADYTHDLLMGETIWLSFDRDCVDPYDRTLAFLHTGLGEEDFVQRLLLRTGQATTLTIAPNDTFEDLFDEEQAAARSTGEGLWAACGGNP